ncbi:polyphosphate--glucose phosphotransferase [Rhodococcus sp. BS-15]|uniref:polyphosphate--glucose phosphotransferase n=1 Tax=Rhodococcus sp. BS-15 TaxID=1304954 RepID=UPI0035B5059F
MTQAGSDNTTAAAARHGFGVDVGGSGIKGGIVDLSTGELVGDRYKIETPQPSTPRCRRAHRRRDRRALRVDRSGGRHTACRGDRRCRSLGRQHRQVLDRHRRRALFAKAIGTENVTVLNDADAAGVAEDKYGGGKGKDGVVVLLTFGTGIGSAVLHNGVLLPNTEFGHMEVDGKEAEHRAASSVKENQGLSYKEWAKEVSKVLETFEALLWPDLFIAGGGISRKSEKWIPHLTNRTPVVPATLLNTAGIVGAALAADSAVPSAETGTSAGSVD